ncbi:glycoside hydrolase family 140 protein [Paenibacillus sp. GCM10023252]|uniref:glycoside hydrolase family 140 protein n=1 Tax=Paenibacillus sp. GCM10023252 TaxID=3252649 RepID=UPI00360806C0
MQALKVSANNRFLMTEDGAPFFWLGDTAWELFHKLSREEAALYLESRAEQGFNVIQAVGLAEVEGLTKGNAYGRKPLLHNEAGLNDPAQPDVSGDYSYWAHMDFIIDKAAELGLYMALLPTWGDKINRMWGEGPVIFTPDNARVFGQWIGARYRDRSNIIWVLGGDRPLHTREHFEIIHGMAQGIKEGDGGEHLITFHPMGGQSSSQHVHEEDWLDFNMIQSGHGAGVRDNYTKVEADYARTPIKPTLDGEPCYEDHPIGFNPALGYFDSADVRTAAYYAVFAGAFGHTYGHHSIWSMTTEPKDYFIVTWKDALDRPAANQMKHLKTLLLSKDFYSRVPSQELILDNYTGSNYIAATRGDGYALLYCPNGLPAQVNTTLLPEVQLQASWYNPRSGEHSSDWQVERKDSAESGISFTPPSSGRGDDWVLVLEWSEER